MSTEQITLRLPSEMVTTLRDGARASRRSLAQQVAWLLDRSPLTETDRSTLTPLVEDCVTTDAPGKAGGTTSPIDTIGGTIIIGDGQASFRRDATPKDRGVTPRFKAAKGRP